MLILESRDIEKSYDGRQLFEIESLEIRSGERIGLVGSNGSGKSTLLKILAGQIQPDRGNVTGRGTTVLAEQFPHERQRILARETAGPWSVPLRLQMSGGEETRAQLAEVLARPSHLLLLDEPTSNLDMEGIIRLEKELRHRSGAVVLVSHDRTTLDNLCTHIWHLNEGKLEVYRGNYSAFEKESARRELEALHHYEQYASEKQRLQRALSEKKQQSQSMRKTPKRMGNAEARLHKRAVGTKKSKLDRGAKAIESRLEQLQAVEKPVEQSPVRFDLAPEDTLNSAFAVQAQDAAGRAGRSIVFSDLNMQLPKGAKLAVVGPNGSGKTTFFRCLEQGCQGLTVPGSASMGFFHQDMRTLRGNKTLLENMMETSAYREAFVRTILARLLFARHQMQQPVSQLSGGERVKASLAKIILGRYNVLVLDEPTNYLDITGLDALAEVLQAYPETLLFATHDRRFIAGTGTHILDFGRMPPRFFPGTWDQYQQPTTEKGAGRLVLETRAAALTAKLHELTDEDERQSIETELQSITQQLRNQ